MLFRSHNILASIFFLFLRVRSMKPAVLGAGLKKNQLVRPTGFFSSKWFLQKTSNTSVSTGFKFGRCSLGIHMVTALTQHDDQNTTS